MVITPVFRSFDNGKWTGEIYYVVNGEESRAAEDALTGCDSGDDEVSHLAELMATTQDRVQWTLS